MPKPRGTVFYRGSLRSPKPDTLTPLNNAFPMISFETPSWADELDCAVTLCDTQGIVRYQNDRSVAVNGDARGQSLFPCHNERSRAIIRRLLDEGGRNVYTIEKRGIRKLIYQTVWREAGEVCGLAEFSMEIPGEMPHYIRN